ncbi:hypothetical protein AeMF1_010038 [Aphanomyces euteiches]|nr:hypothetical protein AeMF1_010038 [Aphanomyces euteiches]KAH9195356.1 hypothetical protein AeNC1_002666 [Aphanomyces euteiches]
MVLPNFTADDPEIRRAEARRARDNERVKKLHDGRLRNIGADIAGVKNQLEEKKEREMQEAREEENYAKEQEEIRRYLIRVEADEAAQEREEASKLQREWMNQSLTRSERREADIARSIRDISALDVDKCSVSSAQNFDGEDRMRHDRLRLQAAQVRDWTLNQLSDKEARAQQEMQEERAYSERLQTISRFQQEAEAEFDQDRAAKALEIRRFNEALVAAQRSQRSKLKKRNETMDEDEIIATCTSDFLSENSLQARTSNPGRVRVDHWKGMSKEEQRKIVSYNDQLLLEKQQKKSEDRQRELEESRNHMNTLRQMTEYEHEAEKKRILSKMELQQTLKQQVQEAKER